MDGMKPFPAFQIDRAKMFMHAKNRMPWDVHELCEWLREYAEIERQCADLAIEAYKEHLTICPGPIIRLGREYLDLLTDLNLKRTVTGQI